MGISWEVTAAILSKGWGWLMYFKIESLKGKGEHQQQALLIFSSIWKHHEDYIKQLTLSPFCRPNPSCVLMFYLTEQAFHSFCGSFSLKDDFCYFYCVSFGIRNHLYSSCVSPRLCARKRWVFNESTRTANKLYQERRWTLHGTPLAISGEGTHVGLILNSAHDPSGRVKATCHRHKQGTISASGRGVHPIGQSVLGAKSLYEKVVLPRALYGCELWAATTAKAHHNLGVATIFSFKATHVLPLRTRTVIAQSVQAVPPLRTYTWFRRNSCLWGTSFGYPRTTYLPRYSMNDSFMPFTPPVLSTDLL